MSKFVTFLGVILLIVVVSVILTPLYVFFGWLTGCIIQFFCGQFVVDGLNTLFGTTRFIPDHLPIIGGALGFVGSFFKTASTSKKKD